MSTFRYRDSYPPRPGWKKDREWSGRSGGAPTRGFCISPAPSPQRTVPLDAWGRGSPLGASLLGFRKGEGQYGSRGRPKSGLVDRRFSVRRSERFWTPRFPEGQSKVQIPLLIPGTPYTTLISLYPPIRYRVHFRRGTPYNIVLENCLLRELQTRQRDSKSLKKTYGSSACPLVVVLGSR